jgi:hypothetical protein
MLCSIPTTSFARNVYNEIMYLIVMLLSISLMGIHAVASTDTAPEQSSLSNNMDSTHSFLGNSLNSVANRLDSFFATERADDELGRSTLRIRDIYTVRERALGENEMRYRINLRLPRLEEKFKFDYYQDKKESKSKTKKNKQVEDINRRNRVRQGWTFNADAGVSAAIPPKLVTRARLRRNFERKIFIHRFLEQVTYITDESGLAEETTLQSDKKISDELLFRFTNTKRWKILQKEFVTLHGPSFIQQLSENDAISYNFFISNVIKDKVFFLNAYTISVNYRRNVYKNWFYFDFIPGIEFPKQWSFRRTPFAIFQVEFLFGG